MMKATVNAKRPFNFKVNSSSEKIQIRQGDTIELNTTYEANERYKNATIMYAVTDVDITKTEGNKFTGLEIGTTNTFKVAILSNIKNSRTNNTWLYKNSSKW